MTQQNATFWGVGTQLWVYDPQNFKRPVWDTGQISHRLVKSRQRKLWPDKKIQQT